MLSPAALQRVVRSVTVSYPIPFFVAALLVFAILCFGGALTASLALRWVLMTVGTISFLVVVFLIVYGTVCERSLLRSERHDLASRALAMMSDSDMDKATRGRVLERLILSESVSKPQVAHQGGSEPETEGEEDNG